MIEFKDIIAREADERKRLETMIHKVYTIESDAKYTYYTLHHPYTYNFKIKKDKFNQYVLYRDNNSYTGAKTYKRKISNSNINELYKYLLKFAIDYINPKNNSFNDEDLSCLSLSFASPGNRIKLQILVSNYLENLGFEPETSIFNELYLKILSGK